MVIIIPSPEGREAHMSWVRASTVLSVYDAQSMVGGRCSRKAGGRYVDHSAVCDADLPLNMSPTICSCPLGGPQEGSSSSSLHTGTWPSRGCSGGIFSPTGPLGWGPLFCSQTGYSPHARKRCEIPPAVPSMYIQHSAASHHPTMATQPQLLSDLTSHSPTLPA